MNPPRVRILAPSSERKQAGGSMAFSFDEAQRDRGMNRYSSLTLARRTAVRAFIEAVNGAGFAAQVLRLKGEALDEAHGMNLNFRRSPLMTVVEREVGPLYKALDARSLGAQERRRLREDLVVVCPLLGLLGPFDLVPLYRCPVGAQIPGFGSLHGWWKQHLSPTLNRLCRERTVLSFLPARLRALWNCDGRCDSMVEVSFARRRGDRVLPENAGSARAAGEMARHVIVNELGSPHDLRGFRTTAGHAWSEADSSVDGKHHRLVFVR
jgi:cytoplasmic iron level regulating protein YaaA (DUF328/UPF0246 family)